MSTSPKKATADPADAILEMLRKNNPFSSNTASDPWFNHLPDVLSINRKPFEEICGLIHRKSASSHEPLAGLVLGEAGMGKTHLLRRILDACRTAKLLFVFVRPLFDSRRPLHHLLQEIVLNLSKTNEGEPAFSQFERLVAEIIRDYVRYRVENFEVDATPNNKRFLKEFEMNVFHIFTNKKKVRFGSMEIIEKEAVNYIHQQVPETSKRFLEVVFQYKTPEKRGLIRDWLKGGSLDEDDCKTLGVKSRENFSDEALEQEAREMLISLGVLFERYRLPMIICFDQLDNIVKSELIAGFAEMIHLLVNDTANMLPLAFIRSDSWNERLKKYPDRAFHDRLESNKIPLTNCNQEQAQELVARRIEQIFGSGTKETKSIIHWLLKQLEQKLKAGEHSPREVVLLSNQIVRDSSGESVPVLPTVAESLAAAYRSACDVVAADFDDWDPESEYLKRAAELILRSRENILSCEPGKDKFQTWTGQFRYENDEVPFVYMVNTAKHWKTVLASMERGIALLKKDPEAKCVYITDARYDFAPGWKRVNEQRAMFEQLGGNVLILDQPSAVHWFGLVSLSWKIGDGDILLETPNGLKTATETDLMNFLRSDFHPFEKKGRFDQLLIQSD